MTIALFTFASICLAQSQDATPLRVTSVTNAYAYWHPQAPRLVFQSNAAGNYDLYVVNVDGTGLRRIVDNPRNDITPVYSPDGSKIVFVSERDGNRDVYVCSADGSEQTNLSKMAGNDIHPVWSADGKRILFSSNRGNQDQDDFDIYEMSADGSGLKQITKGPEVDTYASWSPDGKRIVTRRVLGSNNEVFVMNADGSDPKNLTNSPDYDGWPVWSPDGKRICYASGPPGWPAMPDANIRLFVMNVDGSDKKQISFSGYGGWVYDTQPSWAASGDRIAFTRYRPGVIESSDIVVLKIS